METTINERFVTLIETLKMNNSSFSKSIGKSYTAVESIVKGKTRPSYDVLEAVFQAHPDVNADWLVNGKGGPLRSQDTSSNERYLRDYLIRLEEKFNSLLEQLSVKDHQLESKDTQIAGLQRTVDTLLVGKPEGAIVEPLSTGTEQFQTLMYMYKQTVKRGLMHQVPQVYLARPVAK